MLDVGTNPLPAMTSVELVQIGCLYSDHEKDGKSVLFICNVIIVIIVVIAVIVFDQCPLEACQGKQDTSTMVARIISWRVILTGSGKSSW